MPIKFRCLAEQQQAPCHRPTTACPFNASQRIAGTRKIAFREWCLSRIGRRMSTKGHQERTIQAVSSANDIRITAPNVELESFPDHLPKRCILFHYPETERLAKSIAAASGSRVELGEIKWGCVAILRFVSCSMPLKPFVHVPQRAVRSDSLLHPCSSCQLSHGRHAQDICRRLPECLCQGCNEDTEQTCSIPGIFPGPSLHL